MELFHALVLGIVQGLTEFFPVSSSGHLVLIPVLFGWDDQGLAFDTIVHGGTLVAVVGAFWGDLRRGVRKAIQKRDAASRQFFLRILVAAIPGLAVGALFGDLFESVFRGPLPVAISLAVWGIVLWAVDHWRASRPAPVRNPQQVTWAQALIVGCMQAIALIPGTSRSGITMTGGLLSGMDRKTAVDVSFLVSIPTIAAAFAYGLLQLVQSGSAMDHAGMLITGFVAAAFTGSLAIRLLRTYVANHSLAVFAWYRLALAALIILLTV
ncbi:MAG: hypothetical protein RL141_107 [Candidatus Parcubacteria bacterium]|jgi:undecaprenyl-diphosphatase